MFDLRGRQSVFRQFFRWTSQRSICEQQQQQREGIDEFQRLTALFADFNFTDVSAAQCKEAAVRDAFRGLRSAYIRKRLIEAGPALSRCNRCRCIGPRAMVCGQIVSFCQVLLELENSVETAYKSQTIVSFERTMNFLFRMLPNVLNFHAV